MPPSAYTSRSSCEGRFASSGGSLNELVLASEAAAVEAANGGPILDMPVGTGYFTIDAARRHEGLMVGADIASGMVEQTASAARAAGLDNLSPLQADAHDLPFADETFPAIVCANGLQVIPGLERACDEIVRVLKSDGMLFVSVVVLPVGAVAPALARHLPTFLRGSDDVANALERAGARVNGVRRDRLAYLIEATK